MAKHKIGDIVQIDMDKDNGSYITIEIASDMMSDVLGKHSGYRVHVKESTEPSVTAGVDYMYTAGRLYIVN